MMSEAGISATSSESVLAIQVDSLLPLSNTLALENQLIPGQQQNTWQPDTSTKMRRVHEFD